MLLRQAQFRLAADAVTAALSAFPEVAAIALIGSVAQPLRREVSPFSPFRRRGIAIWLGRLCTFAVCPKGKRQCLVPGCGETKLLQQHEDFVF